MRAAEPEEVWPGLLHQAMEIIVGVERDLGEAVDWSLGGGTVLMLRHGHRRSKDIDIFVEDPQLLPMFSPRLHDRLARYEAAYDESALAIKLRVAEGDIDFVAATTLTADPYSVEKVEGQLLVVQSCAEIVARKLWNRGHLGIARDLMDLALVSSCDAGLPDAIRTAIAKSGDAFVAACALRTAELQREFAAIDVLTFDLSFQDCMDEVAGLVARAREQ